MSRKIKWLALGLCFVLLILTRFYGISWGLPYPFHPDERNTATAIQQLQCTSVLDLRSCFNPHFFAYGQFSIYLGYVIVLLSRIVTKLVGPVQFEEAILALRFISATASVATAFVMLSLFQHLTGSLIKSGMTMESMLIVIFSPALIQFAHFGTTESLLMLFFSWLVLMCLKLKDLKDSDSIDSLYVWIGIVLGLAVATKVSSLLFAVIPFFAITACHRRTETESRYQSFWQWFNELIFVGFIAGATAILFSAHNVISWNDFISSMQYESGVASGVVPVFYTRTFAQSIPILFQIERIFPYALGLPLFLLFCIGLLVLPYTWKYNFLRFAFIAFFLPWAFFYTKWTRFMAPLFPLMAIFAAVFISRLPRRMGYILAILCILPGILFMQVYSSQDVRFTASEWMIHNIPTGSFVLQETANVVDLPILSPNVTLQNKNFKGVSFNFYELENDKKLQMELRSHLKKADYIVVPSRRIFMNHPIGRYPIIGKYYHDLFSGALGFKLIAEFKELNDEGAEETWTVFDHPVVRIYKRL